MMTTTLWASAFVVLVAAVSDLATRKIPNIVTIGGVVMGLAAHTAAGVVDGGLRGGLRGLAFAVVGAMACGLLPFLGWRKGEMGGGDVKLFAAIGALVGPGVGFNVQALTYALMLLVILPYRLVRHGAVRRSFANVGIAVKNIVRRGDAKLAYVDGPKLPPVVLAPTIGVAFAVSMISHGALAAL
jgi:prepilin peptidase CpaA